MFSEAHGDFSSLSLLPTGTVEVDNFGNARDYGNSSSNSNNNAPMETTGDTKRVLVVGGGDKWVPSERVKRWSDFLPIGTSSWGNKLPTSLLDMTTTFLSLRDLVPGRVRPNTTWYSNCQRAAIAGLVCHYLHAGPRLLYQPLFGFQMSNPFKLRQLLPPAPATTALLYDSDTESRRDYRVNGGGGAAGSHSNSIAFTLPLFPLADGGGEGSEDEEGRWSSMARRRLFPTTTSVLPPDQAPIEHPLRIIFTPGLVAETKHKEVLYSVDAHDSFKTVGNVKKILSKVGFARGLRPWASPTPSLIFFCLIQMMGSLPLVHMMFSTTPLPPITEKRDVEVHILGTMLNQAVQDDLKLSEVKYVEGTLLGFFC